MRSISPSGAPLRTQPTASAKYLQQLIEQAIVFGSQLSRANILREIGPIAVGANPYFDERRLVLDYWAVACGRERGDSLAGPDEREGARHFDFAFVADADGVDVAFDHCGHFAFLHARPNVFSRILPCRWRPAHWPGACARFPAAS